MVYQTKIVDWHEYAASLSALRHQVFVIEQGVPVELEIDGEDDSACHVAALIDNDQVIGTGRMLASGKIGRMAVRTDMRQQGVGRAVLDALVSEARAQGLAGVSLGAQLSAVGFYQRAGFAPQGDVFIDAGIDHRQMVLDFQQ
jgi:predicted GNAT family N-acyltransferase